MTLDGTTLSIIVPTRNRVALLQRALGSVLHQLRSGDEIIVISDGSSDGTVAWLTALNDPHLRFVHLEVNLGASAARNRGIELARGQYVLFLDDDDAFREDAIEKIRSRFARAPAVDFLWAGRCIHEEDGQGRTIQDYKDDWTGVPDPVMGEAFLPYTLRIATSAAVAIRRSALLDLGGFDTTLPVSEDRDLFIRIARKGLAGAALPDILIDVHQVAQSLSRSTSLHAVPQSDLRVIDRHADYLDTAVKGSVLTDYLRLVFDAYLRIGARRSAWRIAARLRRRGAFDRRLVRAYLRHAPEFRALKRWIRYDSLLRHIHINQK